jgi:hypothetical protein
MAIEFISSSSIDTGASSAVISHTVAAGDNRVLCLAAATAGSVLADHAGTPTYGGTAMTLGITETTSGDGTMIRLWYLLNPAVGTANVSLATTACFHIKLMACSYTGISAAPAYSTSVESAFNTDTVSMPVTVTKNDLIFVGLSGLHGNDGDQVPITTTERCDLSGGFRTGACADLIVTGSSGVETVGWTNVAQWTANSIAALVFNPFGSANAVFFGMNF